MVPSSNRLGNGPLKAEIGVRTSVESPNAVFIENEWDMTAPTEKRKSCTKTWYFGGYRAKDFGFALDFIRKENLTHPGFLLTLYFLVIVEVEFTP